jgi:uncharacterized protein (TIGR02246 family)
MKFYWLLVFVGLAILVPDHSWSKDDPQGGQAATGPKSTEDPAIAAIRENHMAFRRAFDAGDAKGVAGLWTEDGEYVDEEGQRTDGRAAIEKKYVEFFGDYPGLRITGRIDRIRFPNADTAIEDGTVTVASASGVLPSSARCCVVHVKRDGKWQMWSVRDVQSEEPSGQALLEKLGWMIGTWTAENKGVNLQVTCQWIADKQFIEQVYAARRGTKVIMSGKQIVGWDPTRERITSWMFSSDGGHAFGVWTPEEGGMVVQAEGVLPDGTPTTAVNITSKLDDE